MVERVSVPLAGRSLPTTVDVGMPASSKALRILLKGARVQETEEEAATGERVSPFLVAQELDLARAVYFNMCQNVLTAFLVGSFIARERGWEVPLHSELILGELATLDAAIKTWAKREHSARL